LRVLPHRSIRDVDFSPDSSLLATASADGTTMLWSTSSGSLVRTLDDGGGRRLTDISFSPDGTMLATASSDGDVRVWNVATGDRLFIFVSHGGRVVHVGFDPTATYVVSTSVDRTARVWQVAGIGLGRPAALLAGPGGVVFTA